MDINLLRNIGSLVALVTGIFPQAASAGTINGAIIDRAAHNMAGSLLLHQAVGAETGSPSALSVQTTLQHAPDGSTWTNFAPTGTAIQTATLTAANSENAISVDLTAAYRFVRAVTVVSFTGGTTPTVEVMADIALAGEVQVPAV